MTARISCSVREFRLLHAHHLYELKFSFLIFNGQLCCEANAFALVL